MTTDSHLILTVDYELNGDGSGDVDALVIQPMARLLNVAEHYGVPVTVFVDVSEFAAMETYSDLEPAISRVADQLRECLDRGHDVQLHLHPQWTGHRRVEGTFEVNLNRRRIGDLGFVEAQAEIQQGLAWLKKTLGPSWSPLAFRAGGWGIQGNGAVLRALREHGLWIESSVVPGLAQLGTPDWFDFRNTPTDRTWWRFSTDTCVHMPQGPLVQVPIASARIGQPRNLLTVARGRVRRALTPSRPSPTPSSTQPWRTRAESLRSTAWLLRQSHTAKLDYCLYPADILCDIQAKWLQQSGPKPHPVVAIGHTKAWSSHTEVACHEWLAQSLRDGLVPGTYQSWLAASGLAIGTHQSEVMTDSNASPTASGE